MKKTILFIGLLSAIISLYGCGTSTETITTAGAEFDLPTSWTRQDSWHDLEYMSYDYSNITFTYDLIEYKSSPSEKLKEEVDNIYGSSYRASKIVKDDVKIDGQKGTVYSYYSGYDEDADASYLDGNIGFHIDVYATYQDQLYRFSFRAVKESSDESVEIEKDTFRTMKRTLKTVKFLELPKTVTNQ